MHLILTCCFFLCFGAVHSQVEFSGGFGTSKYTNIDGVYGFYEPFSHAKKIVASWQVSAQKHFMRDKRKSWHSLGIKYLSKGVNSNISREIGNLDYTSQNQHSFTGYGEREINDNKISDHTIGINWALNYQLFKFPLLFSYGADVSYWIMHKNKHIEGLQGLYNEDPDSSYSFSFEQQTIYIANSKETMESYNEDIIPFKIQGGLNIGVKYVLKERFGVGYGFRFGVHGFNLEDDIPIFDYQHLLGLSYIMQKKEDE